MLRGLGMKEVFAAFAKALRDMARAEVLWHAIWPPVLALAAWVAVAFSVWADGVALMAHIVPQLPWTGWGWVSQWAAIFLLLAAFVALTYFSVVFLVAVFALPRLISLVAARDYPDLGRHGENVFWGSLANTLGAGAIFVVGALAMLPLLLIPGALLVLPLLWGGWLNQRTFRFDALAEHTTAMEMERLARENRSRFLFAGLGTAAVAYVPLANLLAPVFTALVFVHLGLAALRRQRQEAGIAL
ncbi:MAG: EI24 domain-containing protein [Rhodocyclales bacterium]|jgi:CysZ protein|nr:EI24 domain-containing protein [Rhodocyclales bacterium]